MLMRIKEIIINNDMEYNKFLKNINLYKSILYNNTFFVVKNNIHNKMLDYIIEGLNIKNRRKRIEYVYDKSCYFIDSKSIDKNICGFKNGKCYIQRKLNNGMCNGCCRKCLYQTDYGCSSKNLACKLFNCSEVKSRYEVVSFDDLKILHLLSYKNQFIVKSDYFSMREDVLKDLYAYTFTYSTIRVITRLIRNYILLSRKIKENGL